FQLWKPVVRTKAGSSVPTVTVLRSTAMSVPDQRAARRLHRLAPLVGPGVFGGREEHEPETSFAFLVFAEPAARRDHVTRSHAHAVVDLGAAVDDRRGRRRVDTECGFRSRKAFLARHHARVSGGLGQPGK